MCNLPADWTIYLSEFMLRQQMEYNISYVE